jgi:hypothetical protein
MRAPTEMALLNDPAVGDPASKSAELYQYNFSFNISSFRYWRRRAPRKLDAFKSIRRYLWLCCQPAAPLSSPVRSSSPIRGYFSAHGPSSIMVRKCRKIDSIRHITSESRADFVYMAPPFIAYYGTLQGGTNESTLLMTAYDQCRLYRDALHDPSGLWRHIVYGNWQDNSHWATGKSLGASDH